ncbi:uncharacterized protein (TIGR02302 family) [Pseudochelatococcus lubricantis]|uniref:Uncharacterized protein (TIGR02302 family) n=1 Tax=Pseudochelatococcus lubricantis TaxID=1538102 RepID=A0ABX0UYE3_9HYPH|nr:TIGR02302 family protein [Pseudochelatococcus lubricantis]NIJ56910.1 uncharacterized protein (TIGR02302 family) [Pseudochelatococcus lubricantis]
MSRTTSVSGPEGQQVKAQQAGQQLERAVRRTRIALYGERVWPRLWWPLGVAGIFLAVSWLGLWALLPAGGRMAGVIVFALAFVAAIVPAVAVRYPSRREALRALDGGADGAGLADPASALADTQAMGQHDAASRALWTLHQRRAAEAISKLPPRFPRPLTAQYDRYGLRGALIVALVAAAFIAGTERGRRLALAFDWRFEASGDPVAARVDGWIDPPAYTRLPPVMLDLTRAGTRDVSVPAGSVLVLRSAGGAAEDVAISGGFIARPAEQPAADGIHENRYTIEGSGTVARDTGDGRATLGIAVVPDRPPVIAFVGPPEATRRGGLTVVFRAGDDYGVTAAQGVVSLPGEDTAQALVPPPVVALPLPRVGEAEQELRTTADLAAHPWAGATVQFTLVARDGAGQEGRSETLTVTLPQRPFTNPLAKALVEQRRNLVFHPHDWRDVRLALRALMIAPDIFTPDSAVYLGLVTAERMLSSASSGEGLVAVADFLWGMALRIEDGDAGDTERALRAAQQALQEAIDRNAPADEIARLAQALREAMNRHLSEMARNQARNRDPAAQRQGGTPTQTITPEELAAMIDRMEQMVREGDLAGADRLLQQLNNILNNLQMAQGAPQQGSQAGEAGRAMRSLDEMIRNQQRLRDDTYRQNGEASEGGEGNAGGGERNGDLSGRQQALRNQLERLQRGLSEQGLEGEPGLGAAERAMRDAEERLADGDGDGAVDAQGRALEALLDGAQGLARQMRQAQQGENGEPGSQPGTGEPGPGEQDPLGRSTGQRRWSDGETRVPGADESAIVRARRILEELRRRLGDPTRPAEERDYLERLLRRD